MAVHVYLVQEDYCEAVFTCCFCSTDKWYQRLLTLGKFDNGRWMEFTYKELAEMEAKGDVTRYEEEIVWSLKWIIEANGGEKVRLEIG